MLRRALLIALIPAVMFAAGPYAGCGAMAAAVEKKKGGGASFLQLPTLTATIRRPDRSLGVMTVEIGIDVPDGGLRHRAEQSVPLLRDAYLREMLTYAPSVAPGAAPNPDTMSTQLQRATDRTLGKPGARVLLGSILIN